VCAVRTALELGGIELQLLDRDPHNLQHASSSFGSESDSAPKVYS
jgi:hypothetical protein